MIVTNTQKDGEKNLFFSHHFLFLGRGEQVLALEVLLVVALLVLELLDTDFPIPVNVKVVEYL